MPEEEIIVEVAPDGSIKISTPKHRGRSCKEVSKFLEDGLGKPTDTKYTPAYYMPEERQEEKIRQKNGRNKQ